MAPDGCSDAERTTPRGEDPDLYSTHWSVIGRLGADGQTGTRRLSDWEDAWAHLEERYSALMHFVARRALREAGGRVVPESEAPDVVQSFLAQCVAKDWLARAAAETGRFRSFLCVLVRRFTLNYVARARAQKRNPGDGLLSLDDILQAVEPSGLDPALGHETVRWVRRLLHLANARVRRRSAPNADVVALLVDQPDLDNEALALRLGTSSKEVALRKFRGLRMLREELAAELHEDAGDELLRSTAENLLGRFLGSDSG